MEVKARLFFYPKDKKRTFFTGYRPAFKIRPDDMYNSGEIKFLDPSGIVNSGESVDAIINFISPEYVSDYLVCGLNFTFSEGPNIIGEGEILEITHTNEIT